VLTRAGIKLNVGGFIGWLIKWFIIVVFLMTSLAVLGLQQVNAFLREVVLAYLPQVIIAALILILATVVADFMRKVVSGAAKAANVRGANMVGSISYYAIWIFALIIALSTLGIAPQFMQILFTGIVAMLAIAGGLAFGLGGRDAAQKALENVSENMK
jgi:small-conductance mechanosensitive channel